MKKIEENEASYTETTSIVVVLKKRESLYGESYKTIERWIEDAEGRKLDLTPTNHKMIDKMLKSMVW